MRSVFAIALVLVGIGILSCRMEQFAVPAPHSVDAAPWVRTIDGWERGSNWQPSVAASPRLHPVLVAAGEALVSILALAATTATKLPSHGTAPHAAAVRRRTLVATR